MAYRKHIWRNGEVIKADLLNNMENGIFNEEARALEAEETLDQKIDNGVASVTNAIGVERTRATNAEAELTQSIEAEGTRATTAESNLSSQLTQESTRAQTAESSLRDYVDEKLTSAYKASGSIFFADLPALTESRRGNVYNIKDAFTTTSDFVEGPGKDYPVGTNVAIVEKDDESYEEATVTSTDNPSQMGLYELDGTDYIRTEDTSPVSGKTYYELVITPSYLYDVFAGFIDTSDFITDTDYATTQKAGLVKPDGTTITVDANGVISSIGGGDVSSEEMADVVNILGAKNLLSVYYPFEDIIGHATVTTNANGSVRINGELSQGGEYTAYFAKAVIPKGSYIITTGQQDEIDALVYMKAYINDVEVADSSEVQGGRNTFDVLRDTEVYFKIYASQSFDDDITIYPMCRPEYIVNNDYVPYTKTNRQLTEDVEDLQQATFPSDMTGATSSSDGTHGLVPAPLIADRAKFLRGDGTWQTVSFERSYVGMIIHSTTLNTMAKVVAFYGGTTWIQHSGYVLRGATSGVAANSAAKTGGADTVTLATTQIPSHAHLTGISSTESYGAGPAGSMTARVYFGQSVSNTSYTGGGQAHSTVPNYKSVYIWERTV